MDKPAAHILGTSPVAPVASVAIVLIRLYQLSLASWFGPHCRFAPSCSHYAMDALRRYGLWRGFALALRRIGRCHPWQAGGWDPVQ
ncbi:MAG TPA: membrane protein insertion efficiency factor YidD [Candidatus Binatia bacterium]|nr:membrane protein insertion efficiency factor YidD [Candidatus Binatia bacterium]